MAWQSIRSRGKMRAGEVSLPPRRPSPYCNLKGGCVMAASQPMPPFPSIQGVEFRAVVGFPGYCVGDDGSVWSCWRNGGNDRTGQVMTGTWKRLCGWVDKRRGKDDGYRKVGLMRNGRLFKRKTHQVVLEAFVGPCPEGMQCRHLDDNKSNVRLANLSWGTCQQNADDRIRNGLTPTGNRQGRAKLREEDIPSARKMLDDGLSERKVASAFGVSKGAIRSMKIGKTWKCVPKTGVI